MVEIRVMVEVGLPSRFRVSIEIHIGACNRVRV